MCTLYLTFKIIQVLRMIRIDTMLLFYFSKTKKEAVKISVYDLGELLFRTPERAAYAQLINT